MRDDTASIVQDWHIGDPGLIVHYQTGAWVKEGEVFPFCGIRTCCRRTTALMVVDGPAVTMRKTLCAFHLRLIILITDRTIDGVVALRSTEGLEITTVEVLITADTDGAARDDAIQRSLSLLADLQRQGAR